MKKKTANSAGNSVLHTFVQDDIIVEYSVKGIYVYFLFCYTEY